MALRLKNSTAGVAVTNSCRLSQHSDARVQKEVSLGEVRTSSEILHAKQSATHFILADHDSIQIDDELFAGGHWPTYNKSCQLEELEKQDDLFLAQPVTRLYHLWSRYNLYTDADEHENQHAMSKTTGHHLCQGGSLSKTAPAVAALGQRTSNQPDRPRTHRPLPTHVPKAHPTTDPAVAEAHDRPRQ